MRSAPIHAGDMIFFCELLSRLVCMGLWAHAVWACVASLLHPTLVYARMGVCTTHDMRQRAYCIIPTLSCVCVCGRV